MRTQEQQLKFDSRVRHIFSAKKAKAERCVSWFLWACTILVWALVFILILNWPAAAEAKRPSFKLTVLMSRSTLLPSFAFCKSVAETSKAMYARQGIDMQITGIRKISKRLALKYERLENSALRYSILRAHVRWRLKIKNRAFVMVGPAIAVNPDGTLAQYIGGYAQLSCRANPPEVAMGNIEVTNDLGQSRFYHDVIIMDHEVGHILSAGHDNSRPATIMHEDALFYIAGGEVTEFSERSLSRIRRCIEQTDSGTWGG